MRWVLVRAASLGLVTLAIAGWTGGVPGTSQAAQPTLGFDDDAPMPSVPPVRTTGGALGFDDSESRQDNSPPGKTPASAPVTPQALPLTVSSVAPLPPVPWRSSGQMSGSTPTPPTLLISWPAWSSGAAPRFWATADTLLWWIKDSRVPPLVTTGPQASLGVLGRPGTQVLYGGEIPNDERLGGRFTAGLWLDDAQALGLESSFFFLGQRSVDFAAGSFGDPLLARPFANANGHEDAEQVANLTVPGLPSLLPLAGRVTVSSSSRMWGIEGNAVHRLAAADNYHLDLLGGFRYLRLDERLAVGEDLRVPLGVAPGGGTRFLLDDNFSTRNNFYGGQVGARAELMRGPWSLELLGKVALGDSQQLADIRGATQITTPGLGAQAYTGGLLALPSNIGRYSRDRFAVLPEGAASLGYRVTGGLVVRVGYTFVYCSSVARPGDQIDRIVNTAQLPPQTARVGQPAFAFHGTDFWAQGVNFGLEYQY